MLNEATTLKLIGIVDLFVFLS